ncbi:chitosanase [Streptomyces sp. NBC_01498]|uniref:chitosanase n=1 Tax=Streptomyces sp. NBC_01498 TaxID=2975870 RepID=UPI002E7BDD73|nr:chitosanase [Streptomyces sp. NBC_01498]WTL23844.1 chitosanase [Streptomyces sp. NBC_01498]
MPLALRRLLLALLLTLATLCTACTASAQEDASTANTSPALDDPAKKEIAMKLVSSAENSSLDWRAQYRYIEDIGDGRGYTAGLVGFCTACGDLLKVVERYVAARPDGNVLARFVPALRAVKGGDSHDGLGDAFTTAWRRAADDDPVFRRTQDAERDRVYFTPAVDRGKADGLGVLGQFVYYDAHVMHGFRDAPGSVGFRTIREQALKKARLPAKGGNETAYLRAFLDARVAAMGREPSHSDTSRIETAQRVFLDAGNLDLDPPLMWKVYGDSYRIDA